MMEFVGEVMTSSMLAILFVMAALLIVLIVRKFWHLACKWYDVLEGGW